MGKEKIQKNLKLFTKRVRNRFHPQKVLLFGSFARGQAGSYSDVDIIVVADTFKTVQFNKRLDILYPLIQDLSIDFHVFAYTPQEFARLSPLTSISEAKIHGIPLV